MEYGSFYDLTSERAKFRRIHVDGPTSLRLRLSELSKACDVPIKNAEVPWHLIAIALFFALLKLPGNSYRIKSKIDNLVKGASGQALQNLNIMLGFPENTGLLSQPLFP
ncbi:hypothetical protein EZV62_006711 [Acer yangbiense]|uniref:Uncharacterized protein n=1 Tax=Acer yangbiense TaxID=1000413 RepID=A0A5C7IAL4_9ROSI|nr:hypothetical protein EZV62_006711 [Acer yangbiense]